MSEPSPDRPLAERTAPAFAALMCLAYLPLVSAMSAGLQLLPPDSAHNAVLARNLARGDGYVIHLIQYHAGSFESVTHLPEMHGILQPLLLAGLFGVFGPEESLIRVPGLLFVAATGMLCFLFARRLFGPGAGLLACALILVDSRLKFWALSGTDDAGFVCLFLAAAMAAEHALADGRARKLAVAGLLGGLAILQKLTGIILPVVYLAAAFGPASSRTTMAKRWAILCAPLLPFAALYAIRNYLAHGALSFRWGAIDWIFKSGGLSAWASVYETTPRLLPTLESIGWSNVADIVLRQLEWFVRALFSLDPLWINGHETLTEPGLVAPLALVGLLVHWRRQPRFVALFLLTLLATVTLVCCVWHVEWRFFSLLLPFFAISFAGLVVRAVGAIGLGRWLSPALSLAAVSGVAVLVFRVYSSPAQHLIPQDRSGGCLAWVEQHVPIDSPILAFDPWSITWYTDRPSVLIPWGRSRAVVEVARRYRTDWLVVQAVGPRSQRRARKLISPGFGLSPELAHDGGECQVYRIDPAGGRAGPSLGARSR